MTDLPDLVLTGSGAAIVFTATVWLMRVFMRVIDARLSELRDDRDYWRAVALGEWTVDDDTD